RTLRDVQRLGDVPVDEAVERADEVGCAERVRPVAAAFSDLIYSCVREGQEADALAWLFCRQAEEPGDDRTGLAGSRAGFREQVTVAGGIPFREKPLVVTEVKPHPVLPPRSRRP